MANSVPEKLVTPSPSILKTMGAGSPSAESPGGIVVVDSKVVFAVISSAVSL